MSIRYVKDCFDKNGNFITAFDPYRCSHEEIMYKLLFDEDGYAINVERVKELIDKNGWGWACDAVKYVYSNNIDRNCKGNYTAVYAWRH